jgi:hypothetical protein
LAQEKNDHRAERFGPVGIGSVQVFMKRLGDVSPDEILVSETRATTRKPAGKAGVRTISLLCGSFSEKACEGWVPVLEKAADVGR